MPWMVTSRRKVGKRAMKVLDRIERAAPLRRDDLDQVAHGRRVDRPQELEMAPGRCRSHDAVSPLSVAVSPRRERASPIRSAMMRNARAKVTSSGIGCG